METALADGLKMIKMGLAMHSASFLERASTFQTAIAAKRIGIMRGDDVFLVVKRVKRHFELRVDALLQIITAGI
jgi:hypothetical protein